MKARFLCDMPNARLLRNKLDKGEGLECKFVIERVVYLSKRDFIPFREHLMEATPFVSCHKEDMFIDEQGIWHVLMFCCLQSDIILLVNSNGEDYAKYCSIISNGGEKVEPRFTTSQRYTRRWKKNCRRAVAVKQDLRTWRQIR